MLTMDKILPYCSIKQPTTQKTIKPANFVAHGKKPHKLFGLLVGCFNKSGSTGFDSNMLGRCRFLNQALTGKKQSKVQYFTPVTHAVAA